MRVLWLALCVLLLACQVPPVRGPGGAVRPGGFKGKDALAGISVVETVIAPSGASVAQYGADVEHELSSTEAAVARSLAPLGMKHEPALSRMVRELSRTSPDRINIPPALVDGLMAWAGLVDPPPRLIVVEIPQDTAACYRRPGPGCREAIASLVEQVGSTQPSGDAVYFGVGVTRVRGPATRMIAAVLERAVALEPIPTQVATGSEVEITGRLLGGRVRPTLEVVDARGRWRQLRTSMSVDGTFSASIDCGDDKGTLQVEILADGEHGPEVAANFPLHCGVVAPDRMTVELERLSGNVSAAQIAAANFTYLNRERERRGLAPLSWDDGAATVALGHSRDMRKGGFVGHRSPTTGDVRARFTRAGIRGSVIRENVARGYGPKGIHDSLMRSPGHRVNMLADDVTHVGIAVVIGAAETNVAGAPRPLYTTQNFFRKPGAGAPATRALAPTLRTKVNEAREARKLPAIAWDPALMRAADRLAKSYARGRSPRKGFEKELFSVGFSAVESHQVRSPDFDALAGISLWSQRDLEAGIGIVRTKGREGEGFLMVVITGER